MEDLLESCLERLQKCEHPKEVEVFNICQKAKEVLYDEPNVVEIQGPVTVCGDIHGQFYDLKELFKVGGEVPAVKYLFMGDWIDRGFYSVETLMWLLTLKALYPDRITLLRGNHESRNITRSYGFLDECVRKFGSTRVWRFCTEVFDYMPIAAVVDNCIFCVHGGISPNGIMLDDIRSLLRGQEIPHDGLLCDLLWSDPCDEIDAYQLSPRGAGFLFGMDAVSEFLSRNNLSVISRSHQLVMEGYKWMFAHRLVTVWSAPNYCYRCGNVASIMEVQAHMQVRFKIFIEAPQEARGTEPRSTIPDYFL